MIRRFLPALAVLAMVGCASPPPPQTFTPLNYSYLPPITLRVANVSVVNQYVPDAGAATLIAQDPANPVTVLTDILNRRLIPSGTPGNATATIESASIEQADGNLVGVMTVRVDVQSADARSTGYTTASVTHSATVPDDPNQMQAALYDMTKQLMDAMNVQLQYQLQHNLGSWLIYTPNAAAAPLGYGAPSPSPVTGTAGGIEATPLTAPPGAASAPPPSYPSAVPPAGSYPPPSYPTTIPPAVAPPSYPPATPSYPPPYPTAMPPSYLPPSSSGDVPQPPQPPPPYPAPSYSAPSYPAPSYPTDVPPAQPYPAPSYPAPVPLTQ